VTIWRAGPLRRALGLTIVVAFSVAALPIYAVAVAPSLGGAALAGVLVAGYGIGGLAGSVLLMVRPFKGDADRLTSVLSGGVAAALVVVVLVNGDWRPGPVIALLPCVVGVDSGE